MPYSKTYEYAIYSKFKSNLNIIKFKMFHIFQLPYALYIMLILYVPSSSSSSVSISHAAVQLGAMRKTDSQSLT